MRRHIINTLGIAAAALALAGSAQAQAQDHGRDHDADQHHDSRDRHDDHHDQRRAVVVHHANGDVALPQRYRAIPPGLAKKPGQMPPGQLKRYTTIEGANTLSGVLRRRGYVVQRIVPSGSSRIVYYRDRSGVVHRAIVSPGTDRLGFSNVPSSLMQEVWSSMR